MHKYKGFIYPTSLHWDKFDRRSIFKQSTFGLNSALSFLLINSITKTNEPSLPNYLLTAGKESRIHAFPKIINVN